MILVMNPVGNGLKTSRIRHQISIEARKTLAHPAFWPGFGVLALFLGLMVFIIEAQADAGFRTIGSDFEYFPAFLQMVTVLAYAAGAAVIAAWDYPDRGIQIWLAHGVSRPTLLLARLALTLLFGLLVVLFAFFVSFATAALSVQLFFQEMSLPALPAGGLAWLVFRLFWAALPYLALTTLIAVATRSPIYAAGGTILYTYVFETLLGNLQDRYTFLQFLPGQLAQLLLTGSTAPEGVAGEGLSSLTTLQVIAGIGIIALILNGLAMLWFTRQDLGG